MEMRIGVDFDNTIVSYDALIHRVAAEWGLIPDDAEKSKKIIRDQIRQLPDGEIEWQKVQAEVYGPRMQEANLIDGVGVFFAHCQREKIQTFIVSHKTKYANFDRTSTDLRAAALAWMKKEGFFASEGMGLSPTVVFFEATRAEKIDRIKYLGSTHFIDDLEEVFCEASFPAEVEKILFGVQACRAGLPGVKSIACWKEINRYLFGIEHG